MCVHASACIHAHVCYTVYYMCCHFMCTFYLQVEGLGEEIQSLQQQLKDCLTERTRVQHVLHGCVYCVAQ